MPSKASAAGSGVATFTATLSNSGLLFEPPGIPPAVENVSVVLPEVAVKL
jgi:hypothetical protein